MIRFAILWLLNTLRVCLCTSKCRLIVTMVNDLLYLSHVSFPYLFFVCAFASSTGCIRSETHPIIRSVLVALWIVTSPLLHWFNLSVDNFKNFLPSFHILSLYSLFFFCLSVFSHFVFKALFMVCSSDSCLNQIHHRCLLPGVRTRVLGRGRERRLAVFHFPCLWWVFCKCLGPSQPCGDVFVSNHRTGKAQVVPTVPRMMQKGFPQTRNHGYTCANMQASCAKV